jgi:hypothetical protein
VQRLKHKIYTQNLYLIINRENFCTSFCFHLKIFCLPLGWITITYVTEMSRQKLLSGGRASRTSRRAGTGAAHAQAPGRQAPKREPTPHARVRLPLTCRARPHLTALSATGRPRRRARHRTVSIAWDRVRSPGAFSVDEDIHHSVSTLKTGIVCTRPENHVYAGVQKKFNNKR